MIKHLKTKTGSSLAMVLLVMSIVSILGVAIMSATYMGYTFKISNNRQKTALYVAEAGLDEVATYLSEEVENAVDYSRKVYVKGIIDNDLNIKLLNEAAFRNRIEELYCLGYKKYFNDNRNTIVHNIQTFSGVINQPIGQNDEMVATITATANVAFQNDTNFDARMPIEVASRVVKKNLLKQDGPGSEILTTTIEIGVPPYETPVETTRDELIRNALWSYAVVADKNIHILANNVRVNGNVYAVGTDDSGEGYRENGGIIIGGPNYSTGTTDSASLAVNGNVITNQSLQTRHSTVTSPSTIAVTGNVYCDYLATRAGADSLLPNRGSSITIKGNLTIRDDTELEANNSKIVIDGNYFGFSDGAVTDVNHRQSSSILINSDDIRTASSIKVTGGTNGTGRYFGVNVQDGIYLAGTAYVDEPVDFTPVTKIVSGSITINRDGTYKYTKDISAPATVTFDAEVLDRTVGTTSISSFTIPTNKSSGTLKRVYQTGESVAVKGNYLGYGEVLNATLNADFYDLSSEYFTEWNPTTLKFVTRKKTGTTSATMLVRDKRDYLLELNKENSSIFNLGGTDLIDLALSKVKQALGVVVGDNTLGDGVDGIGNEIIRALDEDFKHHVNLLGDSQVNTNNASVPAIGNDLNKPRNWLITEWTTPSVAPFTITTNTITANYYASNESSKPVIIHNGNGTVGISTLRSHLTNEVEIDASIRRQGIILSKSDIYVLGPINYEGLLYSEGDIYFLSDNQTITNTPLGAEAEAKAEVSNSVTDRVFEEKILKYPTNMVCGLFRQESFAPSDFPWTKRIIRPKVTNSYYAGDENLSFIGNWNTVIRFTNWTRVKH